MARRFQSLLLLAVVRCSIGYGNYYNNGGGSSNYASNSYSGYNNNNGNSGYNGNGGGSYNGNGGNGGNSYSNNQNSGYYNNGGSSSSYETYTDDYYSNSYSEREGMQFTVCEDSVVQITYLTMICNSPYTFYYGNGAHRTSPVCDYGDKLTVKASFKVEDDISNGDNIYVTMAAYDDESNLLASVSPSYLCENYVGSSCTAKGVYSFDTVLKLAQPDGGNSSHFYPEIQMGFSTKPDSTYNLGAVNTECQKWDPDKPSYVAWSEHNHARTKVQQFFGEYGILIGTLLALSSFTFFVWKRSVEEETGIEFEGKLDDKEVPLTSLA